MTQNSCGGDETELAVRFVSLVYVLQGLTHLGSHYNFFSGMFVFSLCSGHPPPQDHDFLIRYF